MNAVYLVPNLLGSPGGIARYCRLVCRALLSLDIPLHVVALADRPNAIEKARVLFPGMQYVPCDGSRAAFIRLAATTCLRLRPDILLVGHPNFAGLGYMLAILTRAKPVVFIYGIDVWQPLSSTRRWGLKNAARIVAISRFTLTKAHQVNGVPLTKGLVLHNCLDPEFEDVLPATPLAPQLLTVARISLSEQYKGHNYVIRALPALLARFPTLTYHIVGDGDGRPVLEQLAVQMGVREAVHFHGVVSDAELHRRYQSASVFIMPSQAEGFGFVFAEAMAYGLPVIGGNRDATVEVVADGETGFLIDPTSVPAIEAATARLLADEALRTRMGQAGQLRVEQLFSFDAFKQTLWTYMSTLATGVG